jgi:hypothetical protein
MLEEELAGPLRGEFLAEFCSSRLRSSQCLLGYVKAAVGLPLAAQF